MPQSQVIQLEGPSESLMRGMLAGSKYREGLLEARRQTLESQLLAKQLQDYDVMHALNLERAKLELEGMQDLADRNAYTASVRDEMHALDVEAKRAAIASDKATAEAATRQAAAAEKSAETGDIKSRREILEKSLDDLASPHMTPAMAYAAAEMMLVDAERSGKFGPNVKITPGDKYHQFLASEIYAESLELGRQNALQREEINLKQENLRLRQQEYELSVRDLEERMAQARQSFGLRETTSVDPGTEAMLKALGEQYASTLKQLEDKMVLEGWSDDPEKNQKTRDDIQQLRRDLVNLQQAMQVLGGGGLSRAPETGGTPTSGIKGTITVYNTKTGKYHTIDSPTPQEIAEMQSEGYEIVR